MPWKPLLTCKQWTMLVEGLTLCHCLAELPNNRAQVRSLELLTLIFHPTHITNMCAHTCNPSLWVGHVLAASLVQQKLGRRHAGKPQELPRVTRNLCIDWYRKELTSLLQVSESLRSTRLNV